MADREVLVSVDIEASGPSPSTGSLVSLGACLVNDPDVALYLELKPRPGTPWSNEAQRVHNLDESRLRRDGLEPSAAMERLCAWLDDVCADRRPVFVGFNAPFDWMFVADYLWRYVGRNPFGTAALDLKSYFMGRESVERWSATRRADIDEFYRLAADHTHHALDDARGQARLARVLLRLTPKRVDDEASPAGT